jgi:hypothetical protein
MAARRRLYGIAHNARRNRGSPFVRQRPDAINKSALNGPPSHSTETHMYIGGGIVGTIVIVLLVLWLLGRI